MSTMANDLPTETRGRGGRGGVVYIHSIVEYLRRQYPRELHDNDIAKALGLTPDRVRASLLTYLRSRGGRAAIEETFDHYYRHKIGEARWESGPAAYAPPEPEPAPEPEPEPASSVVDVPTVEVVEVVEPRPGRPVPIRAAGAVAGWEVLSHDAELVVFRDATHAVWIARKA